MTKRATRKSHSVYPFSRKRVLIPFERNFTVEEFERVKLGSHSARNGRPLVYLF
jgi:hypothetical protein